MHTVVQIRRGPQDELIKQTAGLLLAQARRGVEATVRSVNRDASPGAIEAAAMTRAFEAVIYDTLEQKGLSERDAMFALQCALTASVGLCMAPSPEADRPRQMEAFVSNVLSFAKAQDAMKLEPEGHA